MSDTDEEFLHNCRTDIERQIDLGQMYAIDEKPRPEHCGKDGTWNDGENFYTILNLYAQYHYDEEKAERLLWCMFEDEYPQYLRRGEEDDVMRADMESWLNYMNEEGDEEE